MAPSQPPRVHSTRSPSLTPLRVSWASSARGVGLSPVPQAPGGGVCTVQTCPELWLPAAEAGGRCCRACSHPHPGLRLWQPQGALRHRSVLLLQPSSVRLAEAGDSASVCRKKEKIKGNHLRKGHWQGPGRNTICQYRNDTGRGAGRPPTVHAKVAGGQQINEG